MTPNCIAAFLSFANTAVGLARFTSHLDSPTFDRPLDILGIGDGERDHFLELGRLGGELFLNDPQPCPLSRSKQNALVHFEEGVFDGGFPQ